MSDPMRWYSPLPDGSVQFKDPLSGERLRTGLMPPLIESEPQFTAGVTFMQSRSDSIAITDLYHMHEFGEDLGILNGTTFRDFIVNADYHGLEIPGLSSAELENQIKIAHLVFANTVFGGYPAFRKEYQARLPTSQEIGFQTRLCYTLAQTKHHTPTFNMDLRPGNTQLEEDMLAVKALWKGHEDETALKAFNRMRDWCMIGSVGLELVRREMGKPVRDLTVVTSAGAGHLDKTRKERALGLNASAKFLNPKRIKEHEKAIQIISRISQTGIASKGDLDAIKNYA